MATPEQRYFFDLTGHLHLEGVLQGAALQKSQEAAQCYIDTPPDQVPDGFEINLQREHFNGYLHAFAFDKSLNERTSCMRKNKAGARNKTDNPVEHYTGVGLALGLSFGAAFGAAFDDVGTGLAIGLVLGLAIGAAVGTNAKRSRGAQGETARKIKVWFPAWAAAKRPDRFTLLLAALAVLGAVLILARQVTYGVGLSADFVAYLSTARSLLAGEGFIQIHGWPYLHWPPLYPMLLAAASLFAFDPYDVAGPLNAAVFGLTLFVAGQYLRRHVQHPLLVLWACLAIMLAIPLTRVASQAISEVAQRCALWIADAGRSASEQTLRPVPVNRLHQPFLLGRVG